MTINDSLLSVYPDQRLYGTRPLGSRYFLSEGMRGYMITCSLTGKVVCTWDSDGCLYATTDGLTPYEKALITRVLRIWRAATRILWGTWDNNAKRINDKWGRQYALVPVLYDTL